jgi:hypothetical protein
MPHRESERVLQLSADAGGVDFFRHWNEHRAWRFTYKNSSHMIDSPELVHGRATPDPPYDFLTLSEAIHALSPDGEWVSWSVLDVHPEYKQQIWQLRKQTIETAAEGRWKFARKQDSQWAHACGQPLPGRSEQLSGPAIHPGSTLDTILGASIAVIEHLRKVPMSPDEIREFETTMIRVLEKRKTVHPERS